MNTVIISGRLNADPEISVRTDKNNMEQKMAKYTIVQSNTAGQGWKNDINFIPCICFGRTAEIAAEHLKQGKLVTVSGRFQGKLIDGSEGKTFFANIIVDKQVFEPDKKEGDEMWR